MQSNGTAAGTGRDENPSSLRRFAALLRPYASRFVLVLVVLFVLTGVNMMLPWFTKLLLDDVFPHDNWSLLWLILGGILVVYVLRNLLYFTSKFTTVGVGENVCFHLRNRLFERMQQMSLQFYQKNPPGQISSRVMDDTFVIQSFIQDELPKLLQSVIMFQALLVILYVTNWQLALAATIVLPGHLWAARWFKRPIKSSSKEAQQQLGVVHGNLIEKFLGVEVVKGFTAEQRESEAFQQAINASRKSQMRSKTYHVTQKVVADLLVGVGTIALIGFGSYQVLKPRDPMQPGVFMAFFAYVLMLYPTVLELMSGFAKLTKSSASIDRVFEMMETTEGEQEIAAPIVVPIRGHIRFENVSFRYNDGPPVLRSMSFEIPAGQTCAIIGPSGAGKSTLVSMVPRFIEAQLGQVQVDGVDVGKLDLRHLRESIGIAFQECFLFDSSVFENLRYARPDATMNQIVEVAKRTGAHDFISKLPNGYGTIIGRDGVSMSRGERQRITLTRAMLKNPKVLILDEATASIDTVSESQIIPAILEFMRGKTTLMITHRPELVRHADIVLQLVDGRIEYQGPPEELPSDALGTHMDDARTQSSREDWGLTRSWLLAAAIGLSCLLGGPALGQDKQPAEEPPAEQENQQEQPAEAEEQNQERPDRPPAQPAAEPAFGMLLPMPNLGTVEIQELVDVASTQAQTELQYEVAGEAMDAALPAPPQGVMKLVTLARSSEQGLRLIQIGYKTFVSQPTHIWVYGQIQQPEEALPNDDLPRIANFLNNAREVMAESTAQLKPSALAHQRIPLSYADPARTIQMLQTFGYTIGQPGEPVDMKNLPVIVPIAETKNHEMVKDKNQTFPLTESDPVNELLVFYMPSKPEQFSEVLDVIRRTIDLPARQIMIEAMVLEIAETGLDRLGVEWELESPTGNFASVKFGRLPIFATATNEEPTADIELEDVFGSFSTKIQALVRRGEAEVLSRPSVLTLNNRMANIAVEERIPVVNSIATGKNDVVTVNFAKPIQAGITLNVRPRVSADNEEISMQVVASVSARVPGGDVIVKNNAGDEVARSPTIQARDVKTYTRIANNTPFIIGGLIAKDDQTETDKVPLLGDIPLVGDLLFSSRRVTKERREVIIVITPYVLPEGRVIGRNMPKDEDAFDSFGQKLFRDAYRIRAEDVFDLAFLFENEYLQRMNMLANEVIRRNFRYADRYPFSEFVGDRLPGEQVLVFRQMYEVIKRLGLDETVRSDRIIFFHPDEDDPSGFSVKWLHRYLRNHGNIPADMEIESDQQLFDALDDKAIILSYTLQGEASVRDILSQPVPEITIVDCPDGEAWSRLLWEYNQPTEGGRQRHSIILHDEDDLTRIKRAALLKHTVYLNANKQTISLANFSVGRLLLMPTVEADKVYLVDEQTAAYFFFTEQYYPALGQRLSKVVDDLHQALRRPAVQLYLNSVELPEARDLPIPTTGPDDEFGEGALRE